MAPSWGYAQDKAPLGGIFPLPLIFFFPGLLPTPLLLNFPTSARRWRTSVLRWPKKKGMGFHGNSLPK